MISVKSSPAAYNTHEGPSPNLPVLLIHEHSLTSSSGIILSSVIIMLFAFLLFSLFMKDYHIHYFDEVMHFTGIVLHPVAYLRKERRVVIVVFIIMLDEHGSIEVPVYQPVERGAIG